MSHKLSEKEIQAHFIDDVSWDIIDDDMEIDFDLKKIEGKMKKR